MSADAETPVLSAEPSTDQVAGQGATAAGTGFDAGPAVEAEAPGERGPPPAAAAANGPKVAERERLTVPEVAGDFEAEGTLPGNAAQLTGEQWTEIIKVNKLLCGYQIREDVRDIVRARFPAFTLRHDSERVKEGLPVRTSGSPRVLAAQMAVDDDFQIDISVKTLQGATYLRHFNGSDTLDDLKSSMENVLRMPSYQQVIIFTGKRLDEGRKLLRDYGFEHNSVIYVYRTLLNPEPCIPEHEVLDASSVQIKETNKAGLSGGAYGTSAGVSSIWQRTKSDTSQSTAREGNREIHAVYNFPRARVLLDEQDLVLSEKCKFELTQIMENENFEGIQRFYRQFGHFFVTSVQLGGQQRTSKYANSTSSAQGKQQLDVLKAAVGLSVNAQFASASTKYATERKVSKDETEQLSTDLAFLGLSACGGNTLIGANIPRWANTLATHDGWRVIEQETVQSLPELIGKIEHCGNIPELFARIANTRGHADRAWNGRIKLMRYHSPNQGWDQRDPLKWDELASGALVVKPEPPQPAGTHSGPSVPVSKPGQVPKQVPKPVPEPIFVVRNATRGDKSADGSLPELRADCPVHLSTDYNLQRDMNPHNQLTGVFVDCDGTIKDDTHGKRVCRFSFRKHGQRGDWKPQVQGQVIESGETVNLYCHSVGLGPFSDINWPPAEGAPVCVNQDGKLVVPISSCTESEQVKELIKAYDIGKLGDDDIAVFEKMGFISDESWPASELSEVAKPTAIWARFVSRFKNSSRVDYKVLQTKEWKNRDIKWAPVREKCYHQGVPQSTIDSLIGHETATGPGGEPNRKIKPAIFTILFE